MRNSEVNHLTFISVVIKQQLFIFFWYFIIGTLWCGFGNIADTVQTADGLGEKKELDSCCRAHDHCSQSICGFCRKEEFNNLYNNAPWVKYVAFPYYY